MQYTHRKLQRSVTRMRRSRAGRASVSTTVTRTAYRGGGGPERPRPRAWPRRIAPLAGIDGSPDRLCEAVGRALAEGEVERRLGQLNLEHERRPVGGRREIDARVEEVARRELERRIGDGALGGRRASLPEPPLPQKARPP